MMTWLLASECVARFRDLMEVGVTFGLLCPRSVLQGKRICPEELSGVQQFYESELFVCEVCSEVRSRLDTEEEPDDKSCGYCLKSVSLSSIAHGDRCATCFLCPVCGLRLDFRRGEDGVEGVVAVCGGCGFTPGVSKPSEEALISE